MKGKAALKGLLTGRSLQRRMQPSTRRTMVLAASVMIGCAIIVLYLLRGRPLY